MVVAFYADEAVVRNLSDLAGTDPDPEVRKAAGQAITRKCADAAITPAEVERAIEVAKNNHRDATLILVAYRHGLRAAEVCRQEMLSLTQIKGPASPGLP